MFENVLVGVDGRSTGRDAIALARRLASADATVTLVHVRSERAAGESTELLEREAGAAGIDATLESVLAGSPGTGLHLQAERRAADLLVVGSCARGVLRRVALGDDTRAALNGAPCAVAIASKGLASHDQPIANVGVAYNGSPESATALAAARDLASAHRAAIHVLKVVSLPSVAYAGYMVPGLGEVIDSMLEEGRAELAELPGVDARVVYGLPGEELAIFGDDVDILLAGSRGYGPLHRLVLGSTCDYLERHARSSLLVLPRTAPVVLDLGVVRKPAVAIEPSIGSVATAWRESDGTASRQA
jgi:nucleotide-binding universal stress UspA family protein